MLKVILVLLFVFLPLITHAKDSPHEIIDVLPVSIGGLSGGKIRSYSEEKYGISRSYFLSANGSSVCATVYVYDMGIGQIPSGVDSGNTQAAFKNSKLEIKYIEKKGSYENVKLVEETKRNTIIHENRSVQSLSARYRYINNKSECKGDVVSFLNVFAANDHFIKIRTTTNSMNGSSLTTSENFIDFVVGELSD
jgi:hypothetical protein